MKKIKKTLCESISLLLCIFCLNNPAFAVVLPFNNLNLNRSSTSKILSLIKYTLEIVPLITTRHKNLDPNIAHSCDLPFVLQGKIYAMDYIKEINMTLIRFFRPYTNYIIVGYCDEISNNTVIYKLTYNELRLL